MQRDRFHQKTQNKDTLYQPRFTNAQGIIDTQKNPDVRINCDNEYEELSRLYGDFVSCFIHMTKDDTLWP